MLATLATIPLALLALVRFREDEQRDIGYSSEDVDGFGSLTSPLTTFAQLIATDNSDANGEPFLASFLFWIPRSIWDEKPQGFGTILTADLEPHLLSTGHSMAAQASGEWFYSWGWFGVIALVPVLGIGSRVLDACLRRLTEHPIRDRRDLLLLTIVTFMAAEAAVLPWNGSFTYSARAGPKVGVLVAVLVLFAWRRRAEAASRKTSPPQDQAGAEMSRSGSR